MNWRITILAFVSLLASAAPSFAQTPPTPPMISSPVELFRRLLATNALGREQFLAAKSSEARRVIETKLREYSAISEEQRTAKLRELDLRWYTQQLMRMKATERPAHLSKLPEPDRAAIEHRLGRFSILPPQLQRDVLTNQTALNLVAHGEPTRGALPLPPQRTERLMEFIELPPLAQSNALLKLTLEDRAQMQKTLSTLSTLSKEDRQEALEGFRKFAALSERERAAFLATAKQWQNMSEKDRQFWRNIVATIESAHNRSGPPLPPPKSDTSHLLGTNN